MFWSSWCLLRNCRIHFSPVFLPPSPWLVSSLPVTSPFWLLPCKLVLIQVLILDNPINIIVPIPASFSWLLNILSDVFFLLWKDRFWKSFWMLVLSLLVAPSQIQQSYHPLAFVFFIWKSSVVIQCRSTPPWWISAVWCYLLSGSPSPTDTGSPVTALFAWWLTDLLLWCPSR